MNNKAKVWEVVQVAFIKIEDVALENNVNKANDEEVFVQDL